MNTELKIKAVEIEEFKSGIPLADWVSVRNTLILLSYASSLRDRRTRGDNNQPIAAEEFRYTARASSVHINQNGGYHIMIAGEVETVPLIEDLVKEAQAMTEKNGSGIWTTSTGDPRVSSKVAPGSLNGEILTIQRIQPEVFLLELNSFHNNENELAKSLGIEQALNWKGVMIRLESIEDRFAIDFDQIVAIVKPLLPDSKIRGIAFAQQLYTNSIQPGGHWNKSAPLAYIDGLELRIGLEAGEPKSWEIQGAVLSGPFEYYSSIVDGLLKPTTLTFGIQRKPSRFHKATSVADSPTKTAMISLADRVAEAFRNR